MAKASITGRAEGGLNQSITAAGVNADFIFVGDTNHTILSIRNFLGSEDLMKSLAETGVTQLALEIPAELQRHIDNFQNGTIDRATFERRLGDDFNIINYGEVTEADYVRTIADTVENARKFGIEVHAVDPGILQPTPEQLRAITTLLTTYQEATGSLPDLSNPENLKDIRDYVRDNGLMSEEDLDNLRAYAEEFISDRLNDERLYDNIVAASQGEKTAIIYGSLHDNLMERLEAGGNSVLVVDVYDDGRDYYRTIQNDNIPSREAGEPDLVFIIKNGEVYVTDKASLEELTALEVQEGKLPPNGFFLGVLPIDPPAPKPDGFRFGG